MLAIVQARMSSTRLPGKVLQSINGAPIIVWQLRRILQAKNITKVVVASSTHQSDDVLVETLQNHGFEVVRGDLDNVLNRFVKVLNQHPEEFFVRLTADCPLFMPEICDRIIEDFLARPCDYLSNTISPTFPNGCDVELVRTETLLKLQDSNPSPFECEHVTIGIHTRDRFAHCRNFLNKQNDSHLRWTLDTERDLQFVAEVYRLFKTRELEFDYSDVMKALATKQVLLNLESEHHELASE